MEAPADGDDLFDVDGQMAEAPELREESVRHLYPSSCLFSLLGCRSRLVTDLDLCSFGTGIPRLALIEGMMSAVAVSSLT